MNVDKESQPLVIKRERECIKKKSHKKDVEMQEQQLRADSKIVELREQLILTKICLDRFKHNEAHLKF